jgi:cell division protein ZapD
MAILYEYPLNERVRTLLRLEDLFGKVHHFIHRTNPLDHHVALCTLFEILDVASRADLKSDLLQELERQRQTLCALKNNSAMAAHIQSDALNRVLYEVEHNATRLMTMTGKLGQHIREHDWLTNIRGRSIIPGGTCEFDLPSYHAWQAKSAEFRTQQLKNWLAPMLPLADSLKIVLHLLRESAKDHEVAALQGFYQQALGGKVIQMIRLELDDLSENIPEISANKYMISIRFNQLDSDYKSKPTTTDVAFKLTLCNF